MGASGSIFRVTILAGLACLLAACSGGAGLDLAGQSAVPPAPQLLSAAQWPSAWPQDALQPWESKDAHGRLASAADGGSVFQPGVQRFTQSAAGVESRGCAVRMASGKRGARQLSYAIYRLPLGALKPGLVSVDANPLPLESGKPGEYYVGIVNFSKQTWEWHGPYGSNHALASLAAKVKAGTSYVSTLGLMYVCIVAYDGAQFDVVGVEAKALAALDAAAPAAPASLSATPRARAIKLNWTAPADLDLAGYRVYYSTKPFSFASEALVKKLPELLDGPGYILPLDSGKHYFRLSTVDISGNESGLSALVGAEPLAGTALWLSATAPVTQAHPGELLLLSASGAACYDWDADGDGKYEINGDSAGLAQAYTSTLGINRYRVRGWDALRNAEALGGVSVLVEANSRPVASATATPTSGAAPLRVTFIGTAEDEEDAPAELHYAWDFDGNGIFEGPDTLTPPAHIYTAPGLYNVKFGVLDTDGAWDIDTLAVMVLDAANQPPVASLTSPKPYGDAPATITLDASGSKDPDGNIVKYEWDFDGDGLFDAYGDNAVVTHKYSEVGVYTARVRVVDDQGGTGSAALELHIFIVEKLDYVWPMSGCNPRLSYCSPYSGPLTAEQQWRVHSDGKYSQFRGIVIGQDRTVYATTEMGVLYAFYPQGGVKWTYYTYSGSSGYPPVLGDDGTIFFASRNVVYAINPDGSYKWSYQLDGDITRPLAIDAYNNIYTCSSLVYPNYGIDAIGTDGNLKWSFTMGSDLSSDLAFDQQDNIYFSCLDDKIYALASDGSLRWSVTTGGAIIYSPAIGTDGTVYFGSDDEKLYAVSSSGQIEWTVTTSGRITTKPLICNGNIHVGNDAKQLYAVSREGVVQWTHAMAENAFWLAHYNTDIYVANCDSIERLASTGETVWSYKLASQYYIHAAVQADGSILSTDDRTLVKVNTIGEEVWTYDMGTFSWLAPVTASDGMIFVASRDMRLQAVSQAGQQYWTTGSGAPFRNTVIAADNTIYALSDDCKLYTITPEGQIGWSKTFGDPALLAVSPDNMIYIADNCNYTCSESQIHALNPDGTTAWQYHVGDGFRSLTVDSDGNVYFSTNDKLGVLDSKGSLLWQNNVGFDINKGIAVGNANTTYIIGQRGKLSAFGADGERLWTYAPSVSLSGSPHLRRDGTILVVDNEAMVNIISAAGQLIERWPVDNDVNSYTLAIGSDDSVYFAKPAGTILKYKPDGTLAWQRSLSSSSYCYVCVDSNDTVFAVTRYGVYAILADGALALSFANNDTAYYSLAIGKNNTLYACTLNGFLYAIGPGAG